MPCRQFCSQKDQIAESSEWLASGLQVFLRSYELLKNFINFYKLRAATCCSVNYDKIPLHGALNIVAVAITSTVCENLSKKIFQRTTIFQDMLICVRCQEMRDVPESILHKVDVLLSCLQNSCAIENIIRQIKEVLFILEETSSCVMSEKLRLLSFLLKEMMQKCICCNHIFEESTRSTLMKMVLNLVSRFIGDWSEKKCQTPSSLRICRFCDQVINETTRQWGIFCCKDAQHFNSIWKEWVLRQSISDAGKGERREEGIKSKRLKNGRSASCENLRKSYDENEKGIKIRGKSWDRLDTDYDSSNVRSGDVDKNAMGIDGTSRKLANFDRTIKHRSPREITGPHRAESGQEPSKKTEVEGYGVRNRKADKFDRVEGRGLTEPKNRALEQVRRKEIKTNRNIDRNSEYPITPDGRKKRDDVPYRGKLRKIRESRGSQSRDEESGASGKTRKIKRNFYRSRSARGRSSGTETEERAVNPSQQETTDLSGRRRKLNQSRLGRSGNIKFANGDQLNENMKDSSRKRVKKLYRNEIADTAKEENVETVLVSGEKGVGKRSRDRRGKKEDRETDEITDMSTEGRKRGKKKADALDKQRRALSSSVGEEGKVLTDDEKRRFRSNGDSGASDSYSTEKRKGVKARGTSKDDKSTLDWEERSSKRGLSRASNERPRRPETSRTDDDYSKISGSRYRKRKSEPSELYDTEIEHRRPIEYQLSDQHFVKLGWTALPIAKTMRKIIEYRASPAKPHLDCPGGKDCTGVERKSQIVAVFDSTGNGAVFSEDGTPRLSYNQIGGIQWDNPTGLSLSWKWDNDEKKSIMKTVYKFLAARFSLQCPINIQVHLQASVEYVRGSLCLHSLSGTFTFGLGSGATCDSRVREMQSVVIVSVNDFYAKDQPVLPYLKEKSVTHLERLLRPPAKTLFRSFESASAPTSAGSSRNKEKKVVIQKPNTMVHEEEEEKVKSGMNIYNNHSEDTYNMKMIHMKLNDFISLKILNRRNINLQFFAGKRNIRIELGTILDLNKEFASNWVDFGTVDTLFKSKFVDLSSSDLPLDSSLCELKQELRRIKLLGRNRARIIAKYRPFLQMWQKSKTRCDL